MKKIVLKDKIIYRADEGRRVRFKHTKKLYSEISLDKTDKRDVEEIKDVDLR